MNKRNKLNLSELKLFNTIGDRDIPSFKIFSKRVANSKILPKLSRFINKYLYGIGVGFAINRYENSFTFYSSIKDEILYKKYKKNDLFINFGSGAFFHKKWKNYDFPGMSSFYKNLQGIEGLDFFGIDLSDEKLSIPEKDNSVELIYCSHTFEHLEVNSAVRFFSECYRILRPSGVMRFALPDIKNYFYIIECLQNQNDLSELKRSFMRDAAFDLHSGTKNFSDKKLLELFSDSNFMPKEFYRLAKEKNSLNTNNVDIGAHKSYWDYEEIIDLAEKIGFSYSIPLNKASSVALPFLNTNVFDNTNSHVSFYIDVIK